MATLKLFEYVLGSLRQQPDAAIHYLDDNLLIGAGRGDLDWRGPRRVLRGVFEQIDEHLFKKHRIDGDEGHIRINMDVDGAIAELGFNLRQRRADKFFDGHPLTPERQAAAFEARHVEQV